MIHLPEKSGNPALTRALTIDPNDLVAALERDRDSAELPTEENAKRKIKRATSTRHEQKIAL